jgi:hypothetical protein
MEEFVQSGRLTDVILTVMAVEVLVVGYFLWRRNQGIGVVSFVASLLSGASLVLALRAALTDAGWQYVALYVIASLLAHLAEIAIRLLLARHSSSQT